MADPYDPKKQDAERTPRDWKFWMIITALLLATFCSALEFTILATALPVIVNDLHGEDFAWVGTAYAIAATSILPLSGGLAEVCKTLPPLFILDPHGVLTVHV